MMWACSQCGKREIRRNDDTCLTSWKWFYRADDGTWEKYEKSDDIEKAYQSGLETFELFSNEEQKYTIYFNCKCELNRL